LNKIKEMGFDTFINIEKEKWECLKCDYLLCVHKEDCLICGNKNVYFPQAQSIISNRAKR